MAIFGTPHNNNPFLKKLTKNLTSKRKINYSSFENDFPVGTQSQPENLVAYQAHSFGVLQMTLHATSADFKFVPAPGQKPYDDSGTIACR